MSESCLTESCLTRLSDPDKNLTRLQFVVRSNVKRTVRIKNGVKRKELLVFTLPCEFLTSMVIFLIIILSVYKSPAVLDVLPNTSATSAGVPASQQRWCWDWLIPSAPFADTCHLSIVFPIANRLSSLSGGHFKRSSCMGSPWNSKHKSLNPHFQAPACSSSNNRRDEPLVYM